mmetsp:Transcript_27744/g.95887  ORF Transcript_27744/g.95887 Transcript_27744/m.95887 type:complete len:228 (-) Transcript_27744:33-716(-)
MRRCNPRSQPRRQGQGLTLGSRVVGPAPAVERGGDEGFKSDFEDMQKDFSTLLETNVRAPLPRQRLPRGRRPCGIWAARAFIVCCCRRRGRGHLIRFHGASRYPTFTFRERQEARPRVAFFAGGLWGGIVERGRRSGIGRLLALQRVSRFRAVFRRKPVSGQGPKRAPHRPGAGAQLGRQGQEFVEQGGVFGPSRDVFHLRHGIQMRLHDQVQGLKPKMVRSLHSPF